MPVKIVGSRPGEKLYEELWGDEEAVGRTDHPKIMRLSRPAVDPTWLAAELAELERLADEGDTLEVVAKLSARARVQTPSASCPRTAAPPAASS